MSTHPRLYGELAEWFHLLTAPEDYEEEAAYYRQVMVDTAVVGGSVAAVGASATGTAIVVVGPGGADTVLAVADLAVLAGGKAASCVP